jgi:hypothetical protein
MSLRRPFYQLERNNFTKTRPLLHNILHVVLFYITTPTPPYTTPTISNQPFTCQISQAQGQPECSHISAQHSPSIARAFTPDIVFGIPYHHVEVNSATTNLPATDPSHATSISSDIISRLHITGCIRPNTLSQHPIVLQASHQFQALFSALLHCHVLPGNYSHDPTSSSSNSSNPSNYIASPHSISTEIASNNVGSYERSQTRY